MKTALINALAVGLGGFFGVLARYGLSSLIHRQLPSAIFPYGTLVVNLLGCLLIGLIAGFTESRQLFGYPFRAFVLIGLLGGFTTFSTFGSQHRVPASRYEHMRTCGSQFDFRVGWLCPDHIKIVGHKPVSFRKA